MAKTSVKLTGEVEETPPDIGKCIICQSSSNEPVSGTSNGRKRIREASSIRRDSVCKRLKLVGDKAEFVYHMNNQCYKSYTLKKTVDKFKRNKEDNVFADTNVSMRRSRSRTTHREQPNNTCEIYNQKCVICGVCKCKKDYTKYRICEMNRARKFLEAAVFFQDEVYTRTCDLQDINAVFGADLYCHKACINRYLVKYDRAMAKPNTGCERMSDKQKAWQNVMEDIEIGLSSGEGYELSYVRDSMNRYLESVSPQNRPTVTNREVKLNLITSFGDKIYFSRDRNTNKSMMFFSKSVTVEDMAQTIRTTDPIKQCAQSIRQSLQSVDFDLNDRFCDAYDLEQAWNTTPIPDPLLSFFAELFDFDFHDFKVRSAMPAGTTESKQREMHSLFQIMYYNLHNGRKRTPMHVMNSEAIHSTCKSATLISSFHHLGLCTSYDELIRHHNDLAVHVVKCSEENVPFPSHFNKTMFTIAAFDNFDHNEATLSGICSSHDTVAVLFQDHDGPQPQKPKISETEVIHGPKAFIPILKCQELKQFYKPSKKPTIPDEYKVSIANPVRKDLLNDVRKKDIAWLLGRLDLESVSPHYISAKPKEQTMPIWSAANSVLSTEELPLKRVAFLPVLPYPVTQYDTVYTAMKNLQGILMYLEQDKLPVTCDEGVFHKARTIQLIRPEEFNNIVLCLGSFHMAKIALGCIGKYLKNSGAENILIESGVFGVNVIESVFTGKNYVRSLKGLQLLKESLERLQWVAFFLDSDMTTFREQLESIVHMRSLISKKTSGDSVIQLEEFKVKSDILIQAFDEFVSDNSKQSETFRYWSIFIHLMSHLENLIRSDREGNWLLQLQSIQDLIPLFAACDSTNYLRWCSLYLEDMYRLPDTAPTVHKAFMEGKFAVKRTLGHFKAVGADMALEQTINKSQKSSAGIIGSSRRKQFVARWEIIYHELLSITNLHRKVCGSNLHNYELEVNRAFNTATTQSEERNITAILAVIEKSENPFLMPPKEGRLHNILTNEVMTEDIREQLLNIETIGKTAYEKFRSNRLYAKTVNFSDSIHRTNLKTFASIHKPREVTKKASAKISQKGDAQLHRMLNIAQERGIKMDELLQYDVCSTSYLFDDEGRKTTATKSDIVHELEKRLSKEHREPSESLKTTYIVDVMANVRKIRTSTVKTFGEFCDNILNATKYTTKDAYRIDFVFDSYLDRSIKDSERQLRGKKYPIEVHNIDKQTPLPVEMERFWSSNSNKAKLEALLHQTAIEHSWITPAEVVVSNFSGPDGFFLPSSKIANGLVSAIPDLDKDIEEADMRCVIHALDAVKEGCDQLVVLSSDSDVFVLFIYYWNQLYSHGLKELWIKTGTGDSTRYISLHTLAMQLGREMCQVLPAVHTLTGCDYTSKFGTKLAGLQATPEKYLKNFGTRGDYDLQVSMAEEYLVKVLRRTTPCKTMDQLRNHIFHHGKHSTLKSLPPTSYATRQHINRAFFSTNVMTSLLSDSPCRQPLDPTSYGFKIVNELMLPTLGENPMPEDFTVVCNCIACANDRCSCRSRRVPCCSFCKCQTGVDAGSSVCTNLYG